MEKLNNYKEKIVNFLKEPILYILIFCIFMQLLIYMTIPNYVMTTDSYTYTTEYNSSILKGEVDYVRTPVYPYLAKIIEKIAGEEMLFQNIVLFQKILFIFTIVLFYDTLKKITKNKVITSVLTVIFGVCPFIIFWNIMVLTEALAIFEIVLLSWITIKYFEKPNKIYAGMIRNRNSRDDYD